MPAKSTDRHATRADLLALVRHLHRRVKRLEHDRTEALETLESLEGRVGDVEARVDEIEEDA